MIEINFKTTPTHIDDIKVGDVVVHDGQDRTVCAADLKHGTFMGTTLFGDSYRCGTVPVLKVVAGE